MINYEQYFSWTGVQIGHFYAYFLLALVVAGFLVHQSKSKYKLELFCICFFLLTGNINNILTLKIPGFSFFEIQPIRFIFLLLTFFLARKALFSKSGLRWGFNKSIPLFFLALFAYVAVLITAVIVNSPDMEFKDVLLSIHDSLAFLVIILALGAMGDRPTYMVLGKALIIGAVATSLVSLVQLVIDPYFLRIGDERMAFGTLLRTNGIFSAEYYNSYYLIIAIAWTLTTVKNHFTKLFLVGLFSLGVVSTFHRMSWLILALVLITYLVYIKKTSLEKLALAGLSGLAVILTVSIFFYQDIMNSTMVKDRLSDNIDSRGGYYTMVLENIGQRPLFGYGDLKNEVYYVNLLRITKNRDRATAEEGSLHSGYFSALFLYGIPAFVLFTLFVVLSVAYYAKAYVRNLYFVIPFLVSIIYMIGNLTNTFLFISYLSVLFAIHIGIGIGIDKSAGQEIPERSN